MKYVRYNGSVWRVLNTYGEFALLWSPLTETVAPLTWCVNV